MARSVPTKVPSSAEDGAHWVPMSSRLVKKSFVSRPGVSVKTLGGVLELAPSTRRPPIRTVISGADSVSRLARSSSWNSAGVALPCRGSCGKPSATGSRWAKDSTSVVSG